MSKIINPPKQTPEQQSPDCTTIVPAPVTTLEPSANRFTLDAQARMARLRTEWADFEDETGARPLTPAEIGQARGTPTAALERAAVFAEAVPNLGASFAHLPVLRDAIAFELAYAPLRDEALAFARFVDLAIMREKYKGVRVTRGLYRMGKSFITTDAGAAFRTYLADLKRELGIVFRKRITSSTPEETAKKN
ncbi:MAG TPA: hypothetical protein VEK57_07880 [Thermoanaerobaculia bacterium]|nr:hypothetical protein [Thermoanaerobaculia bacterium]